MGNRNGGKWTPPKLNRLGGAPVPIIGAKVQPVTITIDVDQTGKTKIKLSRPMQEIELASILSQLATGRIQMCAAAAAAGGRTHGNPTGTSDEKENGSGSASGS